MMITELKDLNVKTLKWLQSNAWVDIYELYDGDQVIASMKFPSWWDHKAIAEIGTQKVIFQPKGTFSFDYYIKDEETDSKIGLIKRFVFRNDEIELYGMGKFNVKSFSFWKQKWGIVDHVGQSIVTFTDYGKGFKDAFKHQATVEIQADFREVSYINLLIASAWYHRVIEKKSHAATAAS